MSDEKVKINVTVDKEELEKISNHVFFSEAACRKREATQMRAGYRAAMRDCDVDTLIASNAGEMISQIHSLLDFHCFGANIKAEFDPDSYYYYRYEGVVEDTIFEARLHLIEARKVLEKVVNDYLPDIRQQAEAGVEVYRELGIEEGEDEE